MTLESTTHFPYHEPYIKQLCWSSHQFWTFPKWDRFIASDNKWLACVFISITLLSLKPRDNHEFQKSAPPRWTSSIKDHLHGGTIFISIKCIQTLLALMHWEDICISTLPDSLRSVLFAFFFFFQTKKGDWWHANFSRSCWHLIRDRDTYIDVNIDKEDFYPTLMQTLTKVSISGNIPFIQINCQTILETHFPIFFITFFFLHFISLHIISFYPILLPKILEIIYLFLDFKFFISDLELRTLMQM